MLNNPIDQRKTCFNVKMFRFLIFCCGIFIAKFITDQKIQSNGNGNDNGNENGNANGLVTKMMVSLSKMFRFNN